MSILRSVLSERYLNPQNMYNNSPKPPIIAIKAIILHTFGAQVLLLDGIAFIVSYLDGHYLHCVKL